MRATSRDAERRRQVPVAKVLLVACLNALVATAACSQDHDSPSEWAARLAATYDPRPLLERMGARTPDASAAAVTSWNDALQGRTTEEVSGVELVTFALRYQPIWVGDSLQEATLARLTARAKTLDRETIAAWKSILEEVHGDGVSEVWTVGLLVSVDRLFGETGGIEPAEADVVRARIRSLPAPAVARLAEILDTGKADVALRMAENDALFNGTAFRQEYFDAAAQALARLVESRRAADGPADGG